MRILVTGREGQVARSLVEAAKAHAGMTIISAGRPQLDLTQPETVRSAIAAARPDLVVSAAAYTAVDHAEDEPELAMAVNASGAGAVARAAADVGAPVVHLSTDYVFSGDGERAYAEDDATGPQNVYGRTKLLGEEAVRRANARHVILRTAWIYSPFGTNFVKTMLRLAVDRDSVSVVADQWGCPTAAHDIAEGILTIAPLLLDENPEFGTYHLAGSGSTNWAGFAAHVFAASRAIGGPWAHVEKIATADYPTKARRPANSRLATGKLWQTWGWRAPTWQESTERVTVYLVSNSLCSSPASGLASGASSL